MRAMRELLASTERSIFSSLLRLRASEISERRAVLAESVATVAVLRKTRTAPMAISAAAMTRMLRSWPTNSRETPRRARASRPPPVRTSRDAARRLSLSSPGAIA